MHIAIIGGGASGLITAWLLQHQHQVEVFERAPIAGGHIRTLNRNVSCPRLPKDVFIENGVLGFHKASYPNFIKLMEKLDMQLLDDRPFARLYTGTSQYPVGMKSLLHNVTPGNAAHKVRDAIRVSKMVKAYRRFDHSLDRLLAGTKSDAVTGPLLASNNVLNTLQRAILMLSFSTPFEDVDDLPAGLSLPYLVSLRNRDWCYVEGGVYHYIEKLLENFSGVLHTNARIAGVKRTTADIQLHFQNGERRNFDKVIFAVSPGQVLDLLEEPTEAEFRRFSPWKDKTFVTVAHTDDQLYNGYDQVTRTPMDLFVVSKQRVAGYSTSMNRAYRLPEKPTYAFSYHLDQMIRAETILDRQLHLVPGYSGEAWKTRAEIAGTNGERHCFFAGAWLDNGLHEGAVRSAIVVAKKFGAIW